jgi:hypothetical protein
MYMIRQQSAIDQNHNPEDDAYITEQQIDDYLIANHKDDEATLGSIIADQQKYEATLKMVSKSNAKAGIYRDATRIWPKPVPVRTLPEKHDWDFFYRSLQAPETRSAILTTMSSGKKPVLKSELRTQRTTTLSERIDRRQYAMQAAIRKQRNVNAIVDTGAQVTTMPESAVNRMSSAHNHRNAPPGTAVKYGIGEIETIERLVDIGHYEVQITPDNCSTSLISVDQIVADGHTVTFSATETIITDDNDRYRLTYPPRTKLAGMDHTHASNGRPVQAPPGSSATPQLTITDFPEPDAGTATACATKPCVQRPPARILQEQASTSPPFALADDPCTRKYHVLRRPKGVTTVEEHQCHTHRHSPSVSGQPMSNLCPCQEA